MCSCNLKGVLLRKIDNSKLASDWLACTADCRLKDCPVGFPFPAVFCNGIWLTRVSARVSLFPLPVSHPVANNYVRDQSWQIEMVDQILVSWRKSALPVVSQSKEALKNTVDKKNVLRRKTAKATGNDMRKAECCVWICCPLDTQSLFKKKEVLASVWIRLNRFFIKIH